MHAQLEAEGKLQHIDPVVLKRWQCSDCEPPMGGVPCGEYGLVAMHNQLLPKVHASPKLSPLSLHITPSHVITMHSLTMLA